MQVLLISSDDRRAGKTATALAIGHRFAREGRAVGYWKPLSAHGADDPDAAFAMRVFRMEEDLASVAPVAVQAEESSEALLERHRDVLARAFRLVAKGKDVLLVEGYCGQGEGSLSGEHLAPTLSLLPGAKMVHVARYRDASVATRAIAARRAAGNAFAGLLINAVPEPHDWFVREQALPALTAQDVPVLGVLPQDRALAGMTVRALAGQLGAHVLVGAEDPGMDELFESVMFGSMSAENGLQYFGRKANKLVLTRGDRPDVHLAALGTSTRCLLLTGGYPSYPFVLDRAAELGVPVLSVATDVQATIDRLDALLSQTRANEPAAIRRFEGLLAKHLDWEQLYRVLG